MISSKDRYFATLVSGYFLMALQIVLSLATVPLALKYLGKETFGVWSLGVQVATWMLLLDAGMNGAIARYLIDYKDNLEDENLARCISTGFRVFSLQGIIILFATFFIGKLSGPAFGLSMSEAAEFGHVVMMIGFGTSLGFVGKIMQSWLYAKQRLDLCNNVSIVLGALEFLIFWFLLVKGGGIYAFAWARVVVSILGFVTFWVAGIRLSHFPAHFLKKKYDSAMFHKLASYGGGVFLLTIGVQLLTMSQTAMVTKTLGLAAAAVWATAPKLFQLVIQTVAKLWDYRVPHLSSLMASDERSILKRDFNQLFRAIAYIGGGLLGVVISLNPVFLQIWTHGKIYWNPINDGLIGIAFYSSMLIRCITDFVMHTKKIGWMPFLMLCEGIVFVALSLIFLPKFGISGMLCASLIAGGALRLPYAWVKFREYLDFSKKYGRALVVHAMGGVFLGVIISILLWVVARGLSSLTPWISLVCQSLVSALVIGPVVFKLGMDLMRTTKKTQAT